MNKIWSLLIIISLIYALFTNRVDLVIEEVFEVPHQALLTTLTIGATLIIWNSLFNIAIESKLIATLVKPLRKLTKILFKEVENREIIDLISLNMIANMIGLGMAATPLSINSLNRLKTGDCLNKSCFKLIIINICTISLFPSTIISILNNYHSSIVATIWIAIIIETTIMFFISLIVFRMVNDKTYEC